MFRKLDPYLVLVVLLSLFSIGPLLQPGYFWEAHDARHSVYFLYEMDRSIQDGVLCGADLTRIVRYELSTRKPLPAIEVAGAIMLNDMCSDGRHVYVSDTRAGRIHRFDGQKVSRDHVLSDKDLVEFHRA